MARPRIADSGGFTLLETIIALTIMVLALASILSVESSGLNAAEKTRQMNTISMLARNKMVETEFNIQGKTFKEVQKEQEGTFDAPYAGYRWKTSIQEIKFPNLGALGSQGRSASGSAGGSSAQTESTEQLGKLVSKYLSDSIREVTVTIFYQRPSGEQSFSVTTYWVDLNHEFSLSE